MGYEELWERVLEKLRAMLSELIANLWFGDAYIESMEGDNVVIIQTVLPKYQTIVNLHKTELDDAFAAVMGKRMNITVFNEPTVEEQPEDEEPPKYKGTNSEYTFENFIVGSSNNFAHAAAIAVATNPDAVYNPLFIYGNSGLGKTHLLNAVMNKMIERNPNINIIYIKGEEFTIQMIKAISTGTQEAFRNKYRKADILLIDDIQFIAGKDSTQEEFFHTFNALYEDKKQIIMTSDRPPRDIKTLEDRLRTRFEWGLIADIQPPDFELRIAIMKNKCRMIGVSLPNEVLVYIAENLKSNIRQIEGAVKRICARSYLGGEKITLDLAKECVATFITGKEPDSVTAEKIVARVGAKYGVSEEDIYGKKRTKDIKDARNISIYIVRKITDMSLPAIGKMYNRDHSTILSSITYVENEMARTPLFDIEIKELIKEITE